jgi:hypothetical protein
MGIAAKATTAKTPSLALISIPDDHFFDLEGRGEVCPFEKPNLHSRLDSDCVLFCRRSFRDLLAKQ